MFLRFIHFVLLYQHNNLYPLKVDLYSIKWTYHNLSFYLFDRYLWFFFPVWAYYEYSWTALFVDMFSFFLDKYLRLEILGHWPYLYLSFPRPFYKVIIPFYIPFHLMLLVFNFNYSGGCGTVSYFEVFSHFHITRNLGRQAKAMAGVAIQQCCMGPTHFLAFCSVLVDLS